MDFPWIYGVFGMVAAYLCGSLPSAVWWGKAFHDVDVREHGSRNAGATNTFRVLGPSAGIPVLVVDVVKGFLPARLFPAFSGLEPYSDAWTVLRVALVAATVIGHLYPVFAGFKGGKGVATGLGGLLAVHPGSALICIGVFILVFLSTRYVSLASLVAAVAFPLAVLLVFREPGWVMALFAIALCLLVFFTHRLNIGRLLRGEESRMSFAGRGADKS